MSWMWVVETQLAKGTVGLLTDCLKQSICVEECNIIDCIRWVVIFLNIMNCNKEFD